MTEDVMMHEMMGRIFRIVVILEFVAIWIIVIVMLKG